MSLDDLDDDAVYVLPDEELAAAAPCSCQAVFLELFEKISRLEQEMRQLLQARFEKIAKLEEELRRSLQERVTHLEAQVRDLELRPTSTYRVRKVLRRSW